MRVEDALSQIEAIHEQLTKAEVYRGFQVWSVASAGMLGLLAAFAQPWMPGVDDAIGFVRYWLIIAAAGIAIAGSSAVHAYLYQEDEHDRRRTRRLMSQLVPCLLAGAAVTYTLPRLGDDHVFLLPGIWAMLFGLGLVASRPYLPRAIGWVCLYHLAAGSFLLLNVSHHLAGAGWQVGGVFGLGQLAAAFVLYRNVERADA